MGQKINPLGFRLGVTQKHHSYWFAQPKNYSELLQEDQKMRYCIENYVYKNIRNSSNYGGIARIEIKRKTDLICTVDKFRQEKSVNICNPRISYKN